MSRARTEEATSPALGRYRPYPEYKDSGVEWLGEIPTSWRLLRLGFTVTECQNGVWGEDPTGGVDDVSCVRVADFDRVKLRVSPANLTYRLIDERLFRKNALVRGDLLIEKSGGGERQPVGAVVLCDLPVPAVCSNFIARMPPLTGYHANYLVYLHSMLYFARVNTRSIKQNTGIQNLDSRSYLSELVAVPTIEEQQAIGAFLDRETARIDELIAKKERLIALLQEKRTALITRAVTKGLDPNVPMKDSGVEWLGEVPTHWRVSRLKQAARMESGHTPDKKVPKFWDEGDIPWVSLADTSQLRAGDYITDTAVRVTPEGIANSSARLLPAGTVVFSRDATIGLCAITSETATVSQHFIGWVCSNHLRPQYLLQLLRSMTQELDRLTMGATVRTIGMDDVRRLAIPVPPLNEQDEIVASVLHERRQVDELSARTLQVSRVLKELRTALISAAVTGKIDVREEAG